MESGALRGYLKAHVAWKKLGLICAATPFALGITPVNAAPAVDSQNPPQVQLIFVNKQGKSIPLDWPARVWWAWRPVRGQSGMQEPVLRVSVRPAAKYKIQKITNPQFEARIEGDRIEIAIQATQANARLTVAAVQGGQQIELDFGVLVVSPTPEALVHPSCKAENLSVQAREAEPGRGTTSNYLYHALWCEKSETGANVHVIRSKDAAFQRGSILPEKSAHPQGDMLRVVFPASPSRGLNKIADYTVAAANGRGKVIYDLNYSYSRLFSFTAGVGGTMLSYSQSESTTMTLDQYAVTVKGGVTYQLLPGKLDLGLGGYANVAAFGATFTGMSGTEPSPAMFLGVNGRVGYTLPIRSEMSFRILAGWYYWSMGVASANYGMAQLSGPQVNLAVSRATEGTRAWSLYLKYAPISDSGNMNLSNRELAVGGAYQLTNPGAPLPLSLTLDLSDMSLTNIQSVNSLSLRTASLGVMASF